MGSLENLPVESCRDAVKALVGSGVFERSPRQEKLFVYLAEKYFAGQSAELKEYTIATEALGRPVDFDPKHDSIVRVEMHRLRKRLREHYAGRGSTAPVKVVLPEKSYELEFEHDVALVLTPAAAMEVEVHAERPREPEARNWPILLIAGFCIMVLVGGFLYRGRTENGVDRLAAEVVEGPGAKAEHKKVGAAALKGKEIRILCGRSDVRYTDQYGHAWEGDRFVTGGEPLLMENTTSLMGYDANILSGLRQGVFRYRIPVEPGVYEVMLVFAEPPLAPSATAAPQEETREFGVRINAQQVLQTFDVKDAVGGYNLAHFRVFKDIEPGRDGKIDLEFGRGTERAFVNAILIRPGTRGKLRPVRIVARRQAYVDESGTLWEADQYFQGGKTISRPIPPSAPNRQLYVGERHGRFTYTIPVTPGQYGATLYFWESWWGEGRQGGGGVGSRIFDVHCNFRPLLERFDILGSTPPPNVVQKTFHGLKPDSEGRLVFSFVPRANRAMVNAIEVFDESDGGR